MRAIAVGKPVAVPSSNLLVHVCILEKNQKIKEKQPNLSRDNAKLTGKKEHIPWVVCFLSFFQKEHRVDSENKRKTA